MTQFNTSAVWLLLLFDRVIKRSLVWGQLCPAQVLPGVACRVTLNKGISWSLFSGYGDFGFYAITVITTVFLGGFAWYIHKRSEDNQDTFGEMLVLVGGTSNLMDRFIYGGVVDFIHVSFGGWSFPIFNFADVFICLGVGFMIYNTLYEEA